MKNCTNCKFAKWDKTSNNRLHPAGNGWCQFEYKLPPLPASMYWSSLGNKTPAGGHINRRAELKAHCVYFTRKVSSSAGG